MSALARRVRFAVRDGLRDHAPRLFVVVDRLRNRGIDALIAILPGRYIGKYVLPEDAAARGGDVENVRVLRAAERVTMGSPDKDPFFKVAQLFQEGWFDRPNVVVCDVPGAVVHVPRGMVCTAGEFAVLADRGLEHRVTLYPKFRKRRPANVRRVAGAWSTLAYCNSENFWHWMIDCLPKIQLLQEALKGETLTIFMPSTALKFQRFMLEAIMPPTFRLEYLDDEWLQPERYVHSSLISYSCVGFLPPSYYEAIRQPIFERLRLPAVHSKTERIFVSRAGAAHRRIRNEDALRELLAHYGFRSVQLEKLPFEEQVALFHRAEIVVGPHGAGIGTIFFSGDIDVVVLYSMANPGNYFHSQAIGMGQRHHFVCHDEAHEDNWFTADLQKVQQLLENDLGLRAAKEAP